MTRKHFELIARLLRERLEAEYDESGFMPAETYSTLLRVAESFATEFAKQNPRFKRVLFLRACGFADVTK